MSLTAAAAAALTTLNPDAHRVPGEGESRSYRYPPTGELFTSVTSVTEGTESKPYFAPWGSRITAVHAATDLEGLRKIGAAKRREVLAALRAESAGVMTRAQMLARARAAAEQAVADELKARSTRTRDLKRDVGSYVHDVVHALIMWAASPGRHGAAIDLPSLPPELAGARYGEDEDPVEDVAGWMVDGFLNWAADFGPRILAAEMAVYHPGLRYAGTLDLIGALDGRALDAAGFLTAAPGAVWTACVDIKTGRLHGATWQEQATAYRRCTECLVGAGDVLPMPLTDGSAVLHLRPEHPRGYRFTPVSRKDDALAWNRFRDALRLVQGRAEAPGKPGRAAYPLLPDGTVPPRRIADLDCEGYGRAPSALAKAGVADLAVLAAHGEPSLLGLKGVGPATVVTARRILADHGLSLAGETPGPEAAMAGSEA